IAAATTEVRKICAMVEQAAAFAVQAMHSSAADYQHHFQGASADLDGLARAMREFETTLGGHDSEIHSLIARLTNGVQNQMDTAAGERIENAELPPARLANAESRDQLAQEIVSTAYQAALRVHDRLQDYAIKELKHALSLALAEIDRIRSSAEI